MPLELVFKIMSYHHETTSSFIAFNDIFSEYREKRELCGNGSSNPNFKDWYFNRVFTDKMLKRQRNFYAFHQQHRVFRTLHNDIINCLNVIMFPFLIVKIIENVIIIYYFYLNFVKNK